MFALLFILPIPKPLDPNAKSVPLQLCDDDGVCKEPYVIYKLKMPEND